jgi:alpha-mannosidase
MKKLSSSILCLLLVVWISIQPAAAQSGSKTMYVAGFDKGISGVDFNYRSPLPQNENAFILRNSFETREMNWLTEPVNELRSSGQVAFVFMTAMSTDNPNLEFSLKVNSGEVFRFTNSLEKTWVVKGSLDGELSFHQAKHIPGVEINGFMILTLPANRIKIKDPLDIKISMLPTPNSAWIIVFKKPVHTGTSLTSMPVLLKGIGAGSQQVKVSQIQFYPPRGVTFSLGGKELLTSRTKIGFNQFFVPVPMVKQDKKLTIKAKYENGTDENLTILVAPVKKWEIYLVQHAHTDIGYTRPQSEILAEHLRYIDYALDYCDQTDNLPDDAKFRWTCESTWVVREYLRTRPQAQIERFKKRIAEGRVEVTGMYFNMAEIADENIMFDFLQPLKEIKDQGIIVKTTMQNDVNGVAWCLPDYLKNTGVRFLTMGINETRSILPFNKPTCFWWEAPSGSRLLAFRSDHYMTGNTFGLPSAISFDPDKVFEYLNNLENSAYPFDRIAVQFSGYLTDNSPPSTGACDIVKNWNEQYESPKLRLATASEFLEYVEKNYSASLPVYRNAWLDWWTDGFGSTSRETAKVRKTQNLKQVDEGMFAMVTMLGGDLSADLKSKIEHISENALFFDEHTVGADESIDHPYSENTTEQWLQKGSYAWEALKKVTLLNEDAMGRIQPYLKKASFPVIYVVNSMGWARSGVVELFVDNQIIPPGKQFRIIDLSANQTVQVQLIRSRSEGAYWAMKVEDVPALGWKAYKIEVGNLDAPLPESKAEALKTIENQYYSLGFDLATGAVSSLYDKELKLELMDKENPWKIGQLVRETLTDRNNMKETVHSTVSNVKMEMGPGGDLWKSVRFSADLAGFEKGTPSSPKGLEWEIRLYNRTKLIEFHFLGRKEILTDPEALYVTFPFNLPGSRIVFETIGGTLTQGNQLPGSSSDWNVAQNFVSVRSAVGQIIMVSDEIPLWQFGGFNLGKFERFSKPCKPWLYSWVMNNYWFTNFRAFQEGGFHWTYKMITIKDTTNSAASKFAWGVRNPFPTRTFPAGNNDFKAAEYQPVKILGSPNIMLVNSRPSFTKPGSVLIHLRELDGKPGNITFSSVIEGRPIRRIMEVNVIGEEVGNALQSVNLKPFEVKFIQIEY